MSMTLEPRRRPIFNRRGRMARLVRPLGMAAAFFAVACLAFSAGLKVGAQADLGRAPMAMFAAISE